MPFISKTDKWLSQKEQLKNAQLVADYFTKKGWSVNAICALLGNMSHESSINPCIWEYGYNHSAKRGFGLVQWTPAQKLYDWCCTHELSPNDGYNQLSRIQYEVDNCIQWYQTRAFPFGFKTFTHSEETIDYLTEAFCRNYERPAQPEKSLRARIDFAYLCFTKLKFYQPKFYIVKQNDTLTKIAKVNNTSVDNIVTLNNIENPNKIYEGQKLLII